MSLIKRIIFTLFVIFAGFSSFAQTQLKSVEEEYFDYLSITGLVSRPYLNYRTLSDSAWTLSEEDTENANLNIWKDKKLESNFNLWKIENPVQNVFMNGIYQGLRLKVYGPELFNSVNTTSPYGQNDGALWQGRGYNAKLSGGVRLEGYGFELTFLPELCFSQNAEFEYIKSSYTGENFKSKAEDYGYYGLACIDAPQRFGNLPFWTFSFGDSEIRWTWKSFTLGFGTQSIWTGPAEINPLIHSNNASPYPKIDIGIRKQSLYFPRTHWYLGNLEARAWWGKLTESDYFDNDDTNNNVLISGLSIAWEPPYLSGLCIGINRTMISKWNNISPYSLFEIYWPFMNDTAGTDESDQRFSLTFDYLIPKAGIELYLEWARNDFSPNLEFVIRYPFHTQAWTGGIKKAINFKDNLKGEFLIEWTHLECSQDYDRLISWASTFYAHHLVTQGYTNRGQWLAAGLGTGGNSQYFGIKLYYPKGTNNIFFQRTNPDLDYSMFVDSKKYPHNSGNISAEGNIRTTLSLGVTGDYFIANCFTLSYGCIVTDDMNPLNLSNEDKSSYHRINVNIQFGGKYRF